MEILSRGDSIHKLKPDHLHKANVGKWHHLSRTFVVQVESQEIAAIRVEWYGRVLAVFLKIFGVNYFQKFFDNKTVTILDNQQISQLLITADSNPKNSPSPPTTSASSANPSEVKEPPKTSSESSEISRDPELLAKLSLQGRVDKAFVEDVLSRKPSTDDEDRFFTEFLKALKFSNNLQRDKVKENLENLLQLIMEIVFSGTNDKRKEHLIEHLNRDDIVFLANHFALVPVEVAKHLSVPRLMVLAGLRHSADNLKAFGRVFKECPMRYLDFQENHGTWIDLFKAGDVEIQTYLLRGILDSCVYGGKEPLELLVKLMPDVSLQVWQSVGEKELDGKWNNPDAKFLDTMKKHCKPDALAAFVKGLPETYKCKNVFVSLQ